MKVKLLSLLVVLAFSVAVFAAGCGPGPNTQPSGTVSAPAPTVSVTPSVALSSAVPTTTASASGTPTTSADIVTTASIVNAEGALLTALSKSGTWIIATLNDISSTNELVVEGDFHDKNDTKNPLYRKLALYAQDASRKITARYTLTAPKLIIKSPNTKIMGGTFKGDVYVQANGFNVDDATIEGNVYFATQEYKSSFSLLNGGKVTGAQDIKS